jgi:hypothetical protein
VPEARPACSGGALSGLRYCEHEGLIPATRQV